MADTSTLASAPLGYLALLDDEPTVAAMVCPGAIASGEAFGTPSVTSVGAASTYYRPSTDVSADGWHASVGSDLYSCIDEVVADPADYIWRLVDSGGPATFGIDGSLPAGSHQVRFGADVTAGSRQLRAVLIDAGGAVVGAGAWQSLTNAEAIYSDTITTSGAATMLRLEDRA